MRRAQSEPMIRTTRMMRWAALVLAVVPFLLLWPILVTLGDLGCRGIDCPPVHRMEPWRWGVIVAAAVLAVVVFRWTLALERKAAGRYFK